MVSGHLIPKAPCASFIFLPGSVVISYPLYPIAYRPRGISGIDSIASEVLHEASTSDIILVAAVATRHIGRCLQKVPSPKQHAGGQDPAALFGDLEDLLDAASGVAGSGPLGRPPGADRHERAPRGHRVVGLGAREPALGGPPGRVAPGLAAHGGVQAQVGVAPAPAPGAGGAEGQAPGSVPVHAARPVHDPLFWFNKNCVVPFVQNNLTEHNPPRARAALPSRPCPPQPDDRRAPAAARDVTADARPASRGMGEGLIQRDAGRGRRTRATAQVFQQLGAGSRGRRRFGSAPSGLRK